MDRKYLHAVQGDNSSKFDENGRKICKNRIVMLTDIFFYLKHIDKQSICICQ